MTLVFSDAHLHTNPISGLGAEKIAKKFKKVNGWFMAIVSLPPQHYGIEGLGFESHEKSIEILLREAERARKEGVEVSTLAGFHPSLVDVYFKAGWSPSEIVELAEKVIDYIAKLHEKKAIDGIGEVGRQHYAVNPAWIVTSELILIYAIEVARDNDMLIHLHLEQGGYSTATSIKRITELAKIHANLLLLHHVSPSEAHYAESYGYWYTVPAKEKLYRTLLPHKPKQLMTESDFIDDPKRPGVSSYPWDIPHELMSLVSEGIVNEEYLYKVEVENVSRFYRVKPP